MVWLEDTQAHYGQEERPAVGSAEDDGKDGRPVGYGAEEHEDMPYGMVAGTVVV